MKGHILNSIQNLEVLDYLIFPQNPLTCIPITSNAVSMTEVKPHLLYLIIQNEMHQQVLDLISQYFLN